MKSVLGLCLDRRVLAGLAVSAAVLWLIAPQLALAALPVLLVLACPLSMALMAWMMRGAMHGTSTSTSAESPSQRLLALEREQARLATEIARQRGELENAGAPEPRRA